MPVGLPPECQEHVPPKPFLNTVVPPQPRTLLLKSSQPSQDCSSRRRVSKQPRHTTSNARKTGQMSLTRLRFFLAAETILLIETKNENATDICAPNIIRITAMKFRFENGWREKTKRASKRGLDKF